MSISTVGTDPDVGAPAASATLFAANGRAMIVMATIIAAIVVFLFVFVFVGIAVSTMKIWVSNHDYKEGYEFHLWIPEVVFTFGICFYLNRVLKNPLIFVWSFALDFSQNPSNLLWILNKYVLEHFYCFLVLRTPSTVPVTLWRLLKFLQPLRH